MATYYVVKTGNEYLYPDPDGDVGLTSSVDNAYRFDSEEEARETAEDHADPGYQIIRLQG